MAANQCCDSDDGVLRMVNRHGLLVSVAAEDAHTVVSATCDQLAGEAGM